MLHCEEREDDERPDKLMHETGAKREMYHVLAHSPYARRLKPGPYAFSANREALHSRRLADVTGTLVRLMSLIMARPCTFSPVFRQNVSQTKPQPQV